MSTLPDAADSAPHDDATDNSRHYFETHPCPAGVDEQLRLARDFIGIHAGGDATRPIVFITVRADCDRNSIGDFPPFIITIF